VLEKAAVSPCRSSVSNKHHHENVSYPSHLSQLGCGRALASANPLLHGQRLREDRGRNISGRSTPVVGCAESVRGFSLGGGFPEHASQVDEAHFR
jgi:hypothetical protein